ncbi:MAG TPA: BTAD domain-containing putative transcriptional regulator [bacterium]|nr:BTAD domain-containing putative transcriptional regulator [bacterium]
MEQVNISLFGKFEMQYAGHQVVELGGRKVRELLCYLLLHRERPHPREKLASILWADQCTTTQSKAYLRKILWKLQNALASYDGLNEFGLIKTERQWVELNTADFWLDLDIFERTYTNVKDIPGSNLEDQEVRQVEKAIQLHEGELLENWYQEWCLLERERVNNMYLLMLDKLMEYCETCRMCETGLEYGTWSLQIDRARESTHQHLMRLYHLAGDRTQALRQYEECRVALQDELGVEPSEPTTILYEQIKSDHSQVPSFVQSPVVTQSRNNDSMSDRLQRINNLQQLQVNILCQIQKEISAIREELDQTSR